MFGTNPAAHPAYQAGINLNAAHVSLMGFMPSIPLPGAYPYGYQLTVLETQGWPMNGIDGVSVAGWQVDGLTDYNWIYDPIPENLGWDGYRSIISYMTDANGDLDLATTDTVAWANYVSNFEGTTIPEDHQSFPAWVQCGTDPALNTYGLGCCVTTIRQTGQIFANVNTQTITCPTSGIQVCAGGAGVYEEYYFNGNFQDINPITTDNYYIDCPDVEIPPTADVCNIPVACNYNPDALETFTDNDTCIYPNIYCLDADGTGACDVVGGDAVSPQYDTQIFCPAGDYAYYGGSAYTQFDPASYTNYIIASEGTINVTGDAVEYPDYDVDIEIQGCMDPQAINYEPDAYWEGTCEYCPVGYIDMGMHDADTSYLQRIVEIASTGFNYACQSNSTINNDQAGGLSSCGRCLHQSDYNFAYDLAYNSYVYRGLDPSLLAAFDVQSVFGIFINMTMGELPLWDEGLSDSTTMNDQLIDDPQGRQWPYNLEFICTQEPGDTGMYNDEATHGGRNCRFRSVALTGLQGDDYKTSLFDIDQGFGGTRTVQLIDMELVYFRALYESLEADSMVSLLGPNHNQNNIEAGLAFSSTLQHLEIRGTEIQGALPSFNSGGSDIKSITITENPDLSTGGDTSWWFDALAENNAQVRHLNLSYNGHEGVLPESVCNIFPAFGSAVYSDYIYYNGRFDLSNNSFCIDENLQAEVMPMCMQIYYEQNQDNNLLVNLSTQSNLDNCVEVCPSGYISYDFGDALYLPDDDEDFQNNLTGLYLYGIGGVGLPNITPSNNYCFWSEDVDVLSTFIQFSHTFLPLTMPGDEYNEEDHLIPLGLHPLRLGWQVWDEQEDGGFRLTEFSMLHDTKRVVDGDTWIDDDYRLSGELPANIGNWTKLKYLRLGQVNPVSLVGYKDQYIYGSIPESFGLISSAQEDNMPLHLQLANLCPNCADGGLSGEIPESICQNRILNNLDLMGEIFITGEYFSLANNNLCPEYPSCLKPVGDFPNYAAGPLADWYSVNLEYLVWDDDEGYPVIGGQLAPQDAFQCNMGGCTDPEALNWSSFAQFDDGSCEYDSFLHFPFGFFAAGPDFYLQGLPGEPGGALTILEMIEILHSASGCGWNDTCSFDIDENGNEISHGYRYNSYSDLKWNDETSGALTIDDGLAMIGGLDENGIPIGTGDYFDLQQGINWGINGACKPRPTSPDGVYCQGDARPYEFLKRVYDEIVVVGSSAYQFIETYFPFGGADISMFDIQYFEDYDINGDGVLDYLDMQLWHLKGRHDIAVLIQRMINLDIDTPLNYQEAEDYIAAPDFEPGMMGYAKDFYYEMIPFGEPTPDGEQMTIPQYEGYEQTTQTSKKIVNYFSDGTSFGISGSNIYTSSISDTNKKYYYGVTDGDPDSSKSDTQFYEAFGHIAGSGSNNHGGNIKGPSEAVYKQYSNFLAPEAIDGVGKTAYGFYITSGSRSTLDLAHGRRDEFIYVLNLKHSRFKDQVQPGSWTLRLSGSIDAEQTEIFLTDDSSQKPSVNLKGVGRVYSIVSGSAGQLVEHRAENMYGHFYPDMGVMVFGERLAYRLMSGSAGDGTSNPEPATFATSSHGNNQLWPYTGSTEDGNNALRFINAMQNVNGNALTLYGEKETTDRYFACIVKPGEFNFTNNPTIISASSKTELSATPNKLNDFLSGSSGDNPVSTMHGNPNTFINRVSLFDNYNRCVATATLSKTLNNNFEKEVVIKVRLSI